MKINGRVIDQPCKEVLVLPRIDGDIIIQAEAVLEMSEFLALCPPPKPPTIMRAGGQFEEDKQDSWYKKQVNELDSLRFYYICLKSLTPSNIEWDTVRMDDPKTWGNWSVDLRTAGLSAVEVDRVTTCILSANSLNEQKLKDAREAFLRGQGNKQVEPSGQDTERPTT